MGGAYYDPLHPRGYPSGGFAHRLSENLSLFGASFLVRRLAIDRSAKETSAMNPCPKCGSSEREPGELFRAGEPHLEHPLPTRPGLDVLPQEAGESVAL